MATLSTIDKMEYEQIRDAYYGTGGFKNGLYIIPTPAESPTRYIYRSNVAKYTNYFKQIVDANLEPAGNGINRVIDDTFLSTWMLNVDGNGQSWSELMESARLEAGLYGYIVSFVDQPSKDKQPEAQEEALKSGSSGKAIKITPLQIVEIKLAGENNIWYLSYQSGITEDEVPIYTIYENGFVYTSSSGLSKDSGEKIRGVKTPSLSKPSILTFESYYDPYMPPRSRFASLSDLAISLYDEQSKVKYQSGATTGSILLNPDVGLNIDKDAKLNENSMLNYNPNTTNGKSPEYIIPDNTIEEILSIIENIKDDMYSSTNMNVLRTGSEASGTSRAYSDTMRISTLENVAERSQKFEEQLIGTFLVANGMNTEFTINYPSEFASLVLTEKIKAGTDMINQAQLSKGNVQLIQLDLMGKYFVGSTKEEKEQWALNEEIGSIYGNEEVF